MLPPKVIGGKHNGDLLPAHPVRKVLPGWVGFKAMSSPGMPGVSFLGEAQKILQPEPCVGGQACLGSLSAPCLTLLVSATQGYSKVIGPGEGLPWKVPRASFPSGPGPVQLRQGSGRDTEAPGDAEAPRKWGRSLDLLFTLLPGPYRRGPHLGKASSTVCKLGSISEPLAAS